MFKINWVARLCQATQLTPKRTINNFLYPWGWEKGRVGIQMMDDSRNLNVQWGSTSPVFKWSTMSGFGMAFGFGMVSH